jgi:hypothetical protein
VKRVEEVNASLVRGEEDLATLLKEGERIKIKYKRIEDKG